MPYLTNELPEVKNMQVIPGKNKLTVKWEGFRYPKKFASDHANAGKLVYKIVSKKNDDWEDDVTVDTTLERTFDEIDAMEVTLADADAEARYNADPSNTETKVAGDAVKAGVEYEPVYVVFGAQQGPASVTEFGLAGNAESVQITVRETNASDDTEQFFTVQSSTVNEDLSNINEFVLNQSNMGSTFNASRGVSYTVQLNAQYRPFAHQDTGYTEGTNVAPLSNAEAMPFTEPQAITFTAVGTQNSIIVTLTDLSNQYFGEKSLLNGFDPLNYITAFITEVDTSFGDGFTIDANTPTDSGEVGTFTSEGNVVFTLAAAPNSTSRVKLQYANSTGTIHMTSTETVETTVASAPEYLHVDLIEYHKISFNYQDNAALVAAMSAGNMVSASVVVEGRICNSFHDTPESFESKSPVFQNTYSAGNRTTHTTAPYGSVGGDEQTVDLTSHGVDSNAKLLELKYYHTVVSAAGDSAKTGSSAKVYIPLLPNASSSWAQNPSFTLTRKDEEFVVDSEVTPAWFEDLSAAWGSSLATMVGLPSANNGGGNGNGASLLMNTEDNGETQQFFDQPTASRGFSAEGVITLYSVSEQNVNSSDICWNTNNADFAAPTMHGMKPILPNNDGDANAIHGASDGNFDAITVNPASDGIDPTGVDAFSMSAGDTLVFHQKVMVDVGFTYKFESYASKTRLVTSDMGNLMKLSDGTQEGIDLSMSVVGSSANPQNKVILSWLPIALDFAGTEQLSGTPKYSVKKFVTSAEDTNLHGSAGSQALLDSFGDASGDTGDLANQYTRVWNDDDTPSALNRGTGTAIEITTNEKTYPNMNVDGSYVTFAVKGTYTIVNPDGSEDVLSTEWATAQCIPYVFPLVNNNNVTSGVHEEEAAHLKAGNDLFNQSLFTDGTHSAVPYNYIGYEWNADQANGGNVTDAAVTHPYLLKIKTASSIPNIKQHWIIKLEKENPEANDVPLVINTLDWENGTMVGIDPNIVPTTSWNRDAPIDIDGDGTYTDDNPQASNLILPEDDTTGQVMWGKDNEYYFQFNNTEIENNREYNLSITPSVVGVDDISHNGPVYSQKVYGKPTWLTSTNWGTMVQAALNDANSADPVITDRLAAEQTHQAAVNANISTAQTAGHNAAVAAGIVDANDVNYNTYYQPAYDAALAAGQPQLDALEESLGLPTLLATEETRYGNPLTPGPVNTGYDYIVDPNDKTKNIGLTGHVQIHFPLLDNDYVSQILFYKGSSLTNSNPTENDANIFKILNAAGPNADPSDAEIINDADKKSIIDTATGSANYGHLKKYSMLIKYKGNTWAPQTLTSDNQYIPPPLDPTSYGISSFDLKLPARTDPSGNAISPVVETLDISATLRNLGSNSVYKHLVTNEAGTAPTGWTRIGVDGDLKTIDTDLSSNGYVIQNSTISKADSSFSLKYQVKLVTELADYAGTMAPEITINPINYKVANYVVENPHGVSVSAIHTDNEGENDLTFLQFEQPHVLYGEDFIQDNAGQDTASKDLSYTYVVEHYNEVTQTNYTEVVQSKEDLAGLGLARRGQYLDIQAHFSGDQQMHEFNLKTIITEQGISDELHGTTVVNRSNETGLTVMAPSNSPDSTVNGTSVREFSEPWNVEIEDLGDVTGVLKFTVPHGQSPYLTNVAGFKLFINEQPWAGARLVEISGQDSTGANLYRIPSFIGADYGSGTQDGTNGLSSSGGNGDVTGDGFIEYNQNYRHAGVPNNETSQRYHVLFSKDNYEIQTSDGATTLVSNDGVQNFDYLSIRTVFTNDGGNTTSKSIAAQVNSVTSPERLENLKITNIDTTTNVMNFSVNPHPSDGADGTYGDLSYVVDIYRLGGGENEFEIVNNEPVMESESSLTHLFGTEKWDDLKNTYIDPAFTELNIGVANDDVLWGQNGAYYSEFTNINSMSQAVTEHGNNTDESRSMSAKLYAALKLETVLKNTRPVVSKGVSTNNSIDVSITGLSPSYVYIATVYAVGSATASAKYSLPVVFDIQNTDTITGVIQNDVGSTPPKLNMKFTLPYDSGMNKMIIKNKEDDNNVAGNTLNADTLVLVDANGNATTNSQELAENPADPDDFYVNKWPTTNQICFSITLPQTNPNYESSFNEPVEFDISLVPVAENERPVVELASQYALFRQKPIANDLNVELANAAQSDLCNNQIRISSTPVNGHHEKFTDLIVLIEWENQETEGMIVKQYNHTDANTSDFLGEWNATLPGAPSLNKVITIPKTGANGIDSTGVITNVYVYGSNEFGMSGAKTASNNYDHTYA